MVDRSDAVFIQLKEVYNVNKSKYFLMIALVIVLITPILFYDYTDLLEMISLVFLG
jgi:hypothetical protein